MAKATTTNISFQTTVDFRDKLDRLTKASGLNSRSRYILRILEKAVTDHIVVREEATYSAPITPRLTDEL
jgi:metal-responsive CopG/Arc/MetJ family transcriptional regulator